MGCPIRKFPDQSLFATPRNLSQRTTSFIASQCQGIHQMPLRRSINIRRVKLKRIETKSFCPSLTIFQRKRPIQSAQSLTENRKIRKTYSLCQTTTHLKSLRRQSIRMDISVSFTHDIFICRSSVSNTNLSKDLVEPDGIEPTTSSLQS